MQKSALEVNLMQMSSDALLRLPMGAQNNSKMHIMVANECPCEFVYMHN